MVLAILGAVGLNDSGYQVHTYYLYHVVIYTVTCRLMELNTSEYSRSKAWLINSALDGRLATEGGQSPCPRFACYLGNGNSKTKFRPVFVIQRLADD